MPAGYICQRLCYHRISYSKFDLNENTSKSNIGAVAALLVVQAAFGTFPVIAKSALAYISSTALVGFRVGITAVVFYLFQRSRGDIFLKQQEDYVRLAILSLFGVTFNQLLFVGGLSLTTASNTSLLAVTIPIFALFIGLYLGAEKLHASKVVGVVLAAAGVILLIDPRNASFSNQTTLGDLMIVANSLSYGIYVVTSKETIMRNGAVRSMTWIFLFAAAICVPLGLFAMARVQITELPIEVWAAILHAGLVATAVPYLLNAWALARVNPSMVAVFIYLQPLIGFVMAVVFLGEHIGSNFILAAAAIFLGVFLVTKGRAAPRN